MRGFPLVRGGGVVEAYSRLAQEMTDLLESRDAWTHGQVDSRAVKRDDAHQSRATSLVKVQFLYARKKD